MLYQQVGTIAPTYYEVNKNIVFLYDQKQSKIRNAVIQKVELNTYIIVKTNTKNLGKRSRSFFNG